MKKLFILVLALLIGIGLVISNTRADEARVIPHKFYAYTASTAVAQGKTIYRITGIATAANAKYGIYNSATLGGASVSVCAVEGGEATSGDPLTAYYFPEGLNLDAGSSIIISGCSVVVEYI